MAECTVPPKRGISPLTIALIFVIAVLAVIGAILSPLSGIFIPGLESIVDTLLNVATNLIYLIGGGIIIFGALAVTIRFIQCKIRDTYQPSCVTRFLSGYLTLSLEFFIGAEIIKTVVTRTYEEFTVLILVIISRGLFSLILYLERRWHGTADTE
ncbi:MAG: DUF1622 domain-containing protein [Candidatus Bathyarchaeota archaeon]|nr:DUF1622 domain-containing protein [Candidatus Bathyarchaeota archaeon]